jgi:hypothetical protein
MAQVLGITGLHRLSLSERLFRASRPGYFGLHIFWQ